MNAKEYREAAAPTIKELHEALFGRKKGSRYKTAPKEDRTWNNIVFHSKHEMDEYLKFVSLEKSGVVHDLKRQVWFELHVNGRYVCAYVADWTCYDLDNRLCVYDAKSGDHRTEIYRLKKKLFEACYPSLRIVEL